MKTMDDTLVSGREGTHIKIIYDRIDVLQSLGQLQVDAVQLKNVNKL
jgi:hypothetical protein